MFISLAGTSGFGLRIGHEKAQKGAKRFEQETTEGTEGGERLWIADSCGGRNGLMGVQMTLIAGVILVASFGNGLLCMMVYDGIAQVERKAYRGLKSCVPILFLPLLFQAKSQGAQLIGGQLAVFRRE